MMDLLAALNWFCALGCGLMAGVYFTFSTFAMRAFAKIDTPSGILAMQSINQVIQTSLFLPLFFATSLASLIAIGVSVVADEAPGTAWAAMGGAVYFIGMFLCTILFNVPLNNRLDAVDPESDEGAEMWALYLSTWTPWNHVRTVACTIAMALFIVALSG